MEADDGGNRSLNSGISIPQWMKNKITDTRLDFDEATFSPPENDDSFLYIRYPQEFAKKLKSPQLVRKNTPITITASGVNTTDINHTDPCKRYILKPGYNPTITVSKTSEIKVKSNGVDDGFKGEGAACGTSVIRVAHQMVAGRYINPATKTIPEDTISEAALKRRGSRSLPVSPISSPKSKRRIANKYFTGAFVDNESNAGGWILQGLLSRREASQSVNYLAEDLNKPSDLVKAVSDLRVNSGGGSDSEKKPKKEFNAKPSEFREMNFWSPTSM